MHLPAERRKQHHPPVAEFVSEAFDHHLAVSRKVAGLLLLVMQIRQQILRCVVVEVVLARQPLQRSRWVLDAIDFPRECPDRSPEFERPPNAVALPERHLPRFAGRRADDDLVARDLLDPPCRRAQQEGFPRPAFIDHLFVQLADAWPANSQEYAIEPAVRDGSGVDERGCSRVPAAGKHVGVPVPENPRLKVGELV